MGILCALAFAAGTGGDLDGLLARIRRAQPPAFRAELRVERIGKRVESVSTVSGRMTVRTGEVLAAQLGGSRKLRIWLVQERSITIQGRSRTARVTDLSRPDRFHPLDLWRRALEGIRDRFRVTAGLREVPLPPAVSGAGGRPVEPARLRRRTNRSLAVAGAAGGAPRVLTLVPRDPALARRIHRIQVEVDRESFRIQRILVDGPYAQETYAVACEETLSHVDEGVFRVDLSNLKLEER